MTNRTFVLIAGIFFVVITVLHILRIVLGWEAVIGGWVVPHGLSWIAAVIFGTLSVIAFGLRRSG